MEPITALPEHVRARVQRDVTKRLAALSRYANADAAIAPLPLTAPFNRRNWLALAPDLRLATLRTNITKQVIASHAKRHARKLTTAQAPSRSETPTPADAPAPVPAPARPASPRYVVPCSTGCGEFLPAKSAKPVRVRCSDHAAKAPKKPASGELEKMIAQLRRDAKELHGGAAKSSLAR